MAQRKIGPRTNIGEFKKIMMKFPGKFQLRFSFIEKLYKRDCPEIRA